MENIHIIMAKTIPERKLRLRDYIMDGMKCFEEQYIDCQVAEQEDDLYTSFHFTFEQSDEHIQDVIHHYISDWITEYMIEMEEPHLLQSIIMKEFFYKDIAEIENILKYAFHLLDYGDFEIEERSDLRRLGRKCRIFTRVYEFMAEKQPFQIEGFIRFRLQEYYEELREVVEYAIDEYVMDKEYQEFIKLLRYFVMAQQPKVQLVQVIHYGDRNFVICNEEYIPYRREDMEGFMKGVTEQDLNYADFIVSTLISVAPKQVLLHTREDESHHVIRTMKNIFEDRLTICKCCPECDKFIFENILDKGSTNLYHS